MRFAKTEVLEWFAKQDRSYRLALLCTHWIRDTAHYKPSASEEARGFRMKVRGGGLSFADLADMLEQQSSRDALSSDFILNQLHALIRVPFEILCDYCKEYDKSAPTRLLLEEMKATSWYEVARIVRNAISHNFHFQYTKHDKEKILPVTWNCLTPVWGSLWDASPAVRRWYAGSIAFGEDDLDLWDEEHDCVIIWQSIRGARPGACPEADRKIVVVNPNRADLAPLADP
jgi:hypothetical protein